VFSYYIALAIASLRRNIVLTSLTVAAIAMGVGTSMTLYTVLTSLSRDPIPSKSAQLYVPQIDNWGPAAGTTADRLPDTLSYRDAMALMQAQRGVRQTALYWIVVNILPHNGSLRQFSASGHGVYRDFFQMFNAPFRAGQPWSKADDDAHANVAVIGAKLADKLFPNNQAVGQSIDLDGRQYRVVGVLNHWAPVPRFYDPNPLMGLDEEYVYVPFTTAIERQMPYQSNNCSGSKAPMTPGWEGQLASECQWIRLWVEIPTPEAARAYRTFLYNYAAEQQRSGRFHWAPRTNLMDLRGWLVFEHVVPDELRLSTLLAFGFFLVCLINAVGLMLARVSSRAGEFGLLRALGASRGHVLLQCAIETAVVGGAGGLLGLALTGAGLRMARVLFNGFGSSPSGVDAEDVAAHLTQLDYQLAALTVAVAVVATLCAGLYPIWRASRVQPAWQLKAQQ
jgi:putative ABC transport system permease protein